MFHSLCTRAGWSYTLTILSAGAYYLASPATHRGITVPLSKATGCRVFGTEIILSILFYQPTDPSRPFNPALDYRLAPETRFPGSLHDAATSYLRLVDDLHIPPQNILIAGDSAGGGLSLALLMYLRDNDYPMPGGAILMSPWVGAYPLPQALSPLPLALILL